VAGEGLLDLLAESVAPGGEPVELFGELADDPAGGLLGRDGNGLGARGAWISSTSRAHILGAWRLASNVMPAPSGSAQRRRRRIGASSARATGWSSLGPRTRSSAGLTAEQHVAQPVRGAGRVVGGVTAAQHAQPLERFVADLEPVQAPRVGARRVRQHEAGAPVGFGRPR
jgi:hypothetical protein